MIQQPIKRPRLALSCAKCRRRKVRCGREHPQCTNCSRMNETCVYNTGIRDELTGRVRHASLNDQNSHSDIGLTNHGSTPETGTWPGAHAPGILGTPGSKVESSTTSTLDIQSACSTNRIDNLLYHNEPSINTKNLPNADSSPHATSKPTAQKPIPICSDYLSLNQNGRSRFISRAFWGSIAGKELESDLFLKSTPSGMTSFDSAAKAINLHKTLPARVVSSALLEVFFIAVWPICPLVDRSSLQKDYDDFWDWCDKNDESLPLQKFIDDPTFFCLLFAILYCGASAAPEARWESAQLRHECKDTILQQLKTNYTASLSTSRHFAYPTMNTLVSTLLIGPFIDQPYDSTHSLVSISNTVRIAQSMGLHREVTWSSLNQTDRETRRRIWWHIVWLDLQSSVSTGLPPCCGSDALDGVRAVSYADNQEAIVKSQDLDLKLLFAIGRSESTHLQWNIVSHLQSSRNMTTEKLSDFTMDTKQLEQTLDTLIGHTSTQRVVERTNQTIEFTRWTRAMLTLMQLETTILLHKPILVSPLNGDSNSQTLWTRIVHLCVAYLRIFIWLHDTPELSPFKWYWHGQYGPLQCALLALTYLQQSHTSSEIPKARSCLADYIRLIKTRYKACNYSAESQTSYDTVEEQCQIDDSMPFAMKVLINLHADLDRSPDYIEPPRIVGAITTSQSMDATLTGNDLGPNVESIIHMEETDFEAWAAFSLSQIF